MSLRPVLQLTMGLPGSHKTYIRGVCFTLEWIREETGVHWSNFPLRHAAIAAYAAKKFGVEEEAVIDRVRQIPADVIEAWCAVEKEGGPYHGPWEFFEDCSLEGCHIALDEAHLFLPNVGNPKTRRRWKEWLREIRHQGATVELITQDLDALDKQVVSLAEIRVEIVNSESRRDPICGVTMADWYEIKALVTRRYVPSIWQITRRKADRKWHIIGKKPYWPDPDLYALYDSYSSPHRGGTKAVGLQRQFQRRGGLGLVFWFFRRNGWNLAWRVAVVAFFCWFFFGGGVRLGLDRYMVEVAKLGKKKAAVSAAPVVEDGIPRSAPARVPGADLASAAGNEVDGAPTMPQDASEAAAADAASAEIASLQQELTAAREQATAAQEAALKMLADDSAITCILKDRVVFSNGVTYGVGEALEGTIYDSTVETIDFGKRSVRLADGTVLRLQSVRVDTVANVTEAAMAGDVRGATGSAIDAGREFGTGAAREHSGVSDAPGRVPAAAEPAGRRLDSVGGAVGFEAGQPRSR